MSLILEDIVEEDSGESLNTTTNKEWESQEKVLMPSNECKLKQSYFLLLAIMVLGSKTTFRHYGFTV